MVGAYDFLNIVEAPDAATIARVSVALGGAGEREAPDVRADRDRRPAREASASRCCLLARHAQSTLNLEQRVNGDPSVEVPLTEQGREEARRLGARSRTSSSTSASTRGSRGRARPRELALEGRAVPLEVEPRLDDIEIGDLEGWPIERYREVKRELGRKRPFPGGECLDDAARRYAAAFRDLAARGAERAARRLPRDPGAIRAERGRRIRSARRAALPRPPERGAVPVRRRHAGRARRRGSSSSRPRLPSMEDQGAARTDGSARSCSAELVGVSAGIAAARRPAAEEAPNARRAGGVRAGAVLRGDARAGAHDLAT